MRMTKLDILLFKIDPALTIDRSQAKAREAVESFYSKPSQISDWMELREYLTEFYAHLEATFQYDEPGDSRPITPSQTGEMHLFLKRIYGPSADKVASKMARYGVMGGINQLLMDMASKIAEQEARDAIGTEVTHFIMGTSSDELWDAAEEYLQEYGRLLPPEIPDTSVHVVYGEFKEILENHPFMIARMRDAFRS